MASSPRISTPVPWTQHSLNLANLSPSTASVRSSSSTSSAVFSIDAPSSQSSVTSGSSGWYRSNWLIEHASSISRDSERSDLQQKDNICLSDLQSSDQPPAKLLGPEDRQHPRRTQRLCQHESSNGDSAPLAPPPLVRQSDRKVNFVDSLVDTTTQMVETIWPLSAYVQSRHTTLCTRQPSKMELRYFIQEVLKRSKASYSTLQVALYYLVLIQPYVPKHNFTQEQPENNASSFSLQCGRRMFIAALILASKYLQDRNFSASGWSKISGLSTWDLNVNEMAFLNAIDWKLHVPDHLFNRWVDIVLKFSPSAPNNGSRSSPRPRLSWKDVVVRLTPQLDAIDLDDTELSDDSGYCSQGSDMSPPPLPARDETISSPNDSTPTPTPTRSIPHWLAHASNGAQTPIGTATQRLTLPPMQPQLAPLPTPDLTPQTDPFYTPAVSHIGFSRRSSMSRAMCQVQDNALSRCTLDRTSEWKPRVPSSFPAIVRRTSLATTASSVSSPESAFDVSSQYSDTSSRPSRSSSISSVASSICAPAQPTPLAMQATRRCANMQLNGSKDVTKCMKAQEASGQPLQYTPSEQTGNNSQNKRKQDTVHIFGKSASLSTANQNNPIHNLPRSFDATMASEDHEAASALQELALNPHAHSQQPPYQRPALQRTDTRKRARPNSMDLSVEDAVRNLITPRCLADITNINPGDESAVLPDDDIADSFFLRKENKHAAREAHKRPTKQVVPARGDTASSRKRTCAGSERGGRGEARAALAEETGSWVPPMRY